jgi:hypothetical protein
MNLKRDFSSRTGETQMPTATDQIREKIHNIEVTLHNTGKESGVISQRAKTAAAENTNQAILDCLKLIAEALESLEKRSHS